MNKVLDFLVKLLVCPLMFFFDCVAIIIEAVEKAVWEYNSEAGRDAKLEMFLGCVFYLVLVAFLVIKIKSLI